MCEDYHSIFDICQEKKTRCSLPHQKGKPFHEESDYAPPCAQHLPQGIGPGSEDFWTKRNLQGLIHRSPCRAGTTNFTAKVANIYIQTSRESVLDRFQKNPRLYVWNAFLGVCKMLLLWPARGSTARPLGLISTSLNCAWNVHKWSVTTTATSRNSLFMSFLQVA